MEDMPAENRLERELNEIEKLERAEQYWEQRLSGEQLIDVPQNPECKFCIVVPVHGERVDRIQKQVDSIRRQTADPATYEVIYVVNNDEEEEESQTLADNRAVIEYVRSLTDLPVFVIDKSSPGNEIPECNVGRARNRGVAEASARLHENGKNGVIIQTDADTVLEDAEYLQKIDTTFQEHPEAVGIAGGLVFELDLDTQDPEERKAIEEKIDRLVLWKVWDSLHKFVEGDIKPSLRDNTFSGANMISRSLESAIIGGLADTASGEDSQFGYELDTYAKHNHGVVLGMKDELKVVTALRDSDRTPASFKKIIDSIDPAKPLEVDGVIVTPELIEEYEQRVLELEGGKEIIERMRKSIQDLRVAK